MSCWPWSVLSQIRHWQPLGSGVNWAVARLYTDTIDSILYSGGGFSMAGKITVNQIAKWDGTSWDSLGSGGDGQDINAITKYKGEIYAGGAFLSMGNVPGTNRIAKWDGAKWDSVPFAYENGVKNAVLELYVYEDTLYVMSTSHDNGGLYETRIFKYDGTNWHHFPVLDSMVFGAINAAIFYKGELYVGGNFEGTCGPDMADIARWDGISWKPVGSGLTGLMTHVNTFAVYKDTLVCGRVFL